MRAVRTQSWRTVVAGVTIALGLTAAGRTAAQAIATLFPEGVPGFDASPGVTVRSRLHPQLEPEGVRVGSFVLRPSLETATGYDGNPTG
ncbi:MAG: outer membrane beta-barrel protein, partial [Rhodospirillales bacterium]|nr:outer membrane beta-barrel protein [Rhodospirillales bacterium]